MKTTNIVETRMFLTLILSVIIFRKHKFRGLNVNLSYAVESGKIIRLESFKSSGERIRCINKV